MNKKIKVIELLNLLAENKIKRGTRIKYGNYTYKIDYPNLCGIYIEGGSTGREDSLFSELDICALNYDVEILEDEEEIDIKKLQGFPEYFIDNSTCGEDVKTLARKCNEFVKILRQLDKKINKEE